MVMQQVAATNSADHAGSQKHGRLVLQPDMDGPRKPEASTDAMTPAKRVRILEPTIGERSISTQNESMSADDGAGDNDSCKISVTTKTVVTPASSSTPSVSSFSTEQTHRHAPTPLTCKNAIEALLLNEAGYNRSSAEATVKRSDYLTWDDYFMATAALSAHRSKDPVHATGACIVDSSNRIIGTGYNGFPAGCSDDVLPWTDTTLSNDGDSPCWLHTKSPYVVHAEVNAILNKCAPDCTGARLYTQHFPCNECAKVIAQSRISEVVYVHEKHSGTDSSCTDDDSSLRASRILLTMAGVRMRQYKPLHKRLKLDFWMALDAKECECATAEATETVVDDEATRNEAVLEHRDLLLNEANYDPSTPGTLKRKGFISWDDYFMSMAFLSAQRSKDPNTQVGACIVDPNKRIVGLGYNGFPAGCSDDCLPWAREASSELHKKYVYVCHAEVNAILNKGSADVKGATLYVALFPCHDCSKVIIQAGIREVVYMSDRYHDTESCRASRIMFQMAGVKLRKHVPNVPSICIQLDKDDDSNELPNGSSSND
jgi:dCMP deaminase